jgi:hypothetical protein
MRRRVLGSLAYLAFLLVCVEVSLQIFYHVTAGAPLFARTAVRVYAPDPWSGTANMPNLAFDDRTSEYRASYYTNSQGFRVARGGGDYPRTPEPDTRRVMLLGPSFAYGWGVDHEQTFAHQLEQLLQRAGWADGRRVEVINAGVPSLGIARQLEWFRHEGREFAPELLIQFVYGSMAVQDRLDVGQRVVDGYLVHTQASLGRRLRERLKRSATVFYAWIVYTAAERALAGGDEPAEVVGAGRELTLQREFRPEAPAVQESLGVYRRLRDEARAAGAELLLVFFPLSYAIHAEDESRWRHHGVRDVELEQAFDAAFCAYLAEREQIPCLDITPELQRAAAEDAERLYYWLDVHWTARGNLVAARAVAERLGARP